MKRGKPRIALIRQRYNPYGGAERIVTSILQELAASGATVNLITRRWEKSSAFEPLIVDPFYVGRLWRDKSFARAVSRLLSEKSFDLVQANEKIPGCDVYRAGDGAHREWLLQRARVAGPMERLWLRVSPYHRFVLDRERAVLQHPRLKAVICISRMVRADLKRHYDVSEDKLKVIYNGVDSERFHPEPREHRRAIRNALAIPDEAPLYLFVGSGYARKGVPALLEAFSGLPTSAYLVIIGKDSRQKYYSDAARRMVIGNRVRFLGGVADVRPYYNAADVFVLPTLYEPFGSVVLEAMASGLPVITSRTCGAGELLRTGEQGFVCDALDVAVLRDCMAQLLDRGLAKRMGESARAIAETMTVKKMADEMMQLYTSLLDERSST